MTRVPDPADAFPASAPPSDQDEAQRDTQRDHEPEGQPTRVIGTLSPGPGSTPHPLPVGSTPGERTRLRPMPDWFGKYQVVSHLATGGMADLYLARNLGPSGFEKTVVIKCIRPELEGGESLELFLDEARLVASLEHPNIAQVYEMGVAPHGYYMAMEYVRGIDLRQLLAALRKQGKPMPFAEAVFIVSQLCGALHYAHDKCGTDGQPLQIIHRDISPSNVLLGESGAVKLCDFGVARANRRARQTEAGIVKGKYAYMSPEQCLGEEIDRRSDVFALGILLYELTLTRRLFQAPSDFETLRAIIEAPIPKPSSLREGYPLGLEAIVLGALAKNPAERFQSALEMQLALEEFAHEQRLRQSAIDVAALVREISPGRGSTSQEAPRSSTPPRFSVARTPPPAPAAQTVTQRSRLLPLSALACLAAGLVSTLAAPGETKEPTSAAGLTAAANRIAAAFDRAAVTARARAEGLALLPVLRVAIDTDAATLADIAVRDNIFSGTRNEIIEIAQLRGDAVTSLLRFPSGPSSILPAKITDGRHLHHVRINQDPMLVRTIKVENREGEFTGAIAVASPIQMATVTTDLRQLSQAAWIEGLQEPLALHGARADGAGVPQSIPLPRLDEDGGQLPPLELHFVPAAAASASTPWLVWARTSLFAVGGVLLLLSLARWLRSPQRPSTRA